MCCQSLQTLAAQRCTVGSQLALYHGEFLGGHGPLVTVVLLTGVSKEMPELAERHNISKHEIIYRALHFERYALTRSSNCSPLILAPQVLGIFTSRFTSSYDNPASTSFFRFGRNTSSKKSPIL